MDTVEQIVKRLNRLKRGFPKSPKVIRFVVEDSQDWAGEPALYIWALLENGTPESEQSWEKIKPIEGAIVEAIFERKDPRYPYVRFRTEQEYEDMVRAWK
jgi:hypothetical protein